MRKLRRLAIAALLVGLVWLLFGSHLLDVRLAW